MCTKIISHTTTYAYIRDDITFSCAGVFGDPDLRPFSSKCDPGILAMSLDKSRNFAKSYIILLPVSIMDRKSAWCIHMPEIFSLSVVTDI